MKPALVCADEVVDGGGKAVIYVAGVDFEAGPAPLCLRIDGLTREVPLHAVAPEDSAHLTPAAYQTVNDPGAVVFGLDPAESVAGGPEIVGVDVRDAVPGANNLRLGRRRLRGDRGGIYSAPGGKCESNELQTAHAGLP